jgi:acyl-CoA thioesterase-1
MSLAENVLITSFFQSLQAGRKQTVVLYGTSLTHSAPWTGMLNDWFEAMHPGQVTLINSGGPGENSTWGLANLQARVVDHKPDLVFIEFASNDGVTRFNLQVEEAANNLDHMIKTIHAKNPDTEIVLQTMNVPWDSPEMDALARRPNLETYNDNYRRYAQAHHLPLLDHYPAWKQFEETLPDQFRAGIPDGSHPNESGIRAAMWPALLDFLEKSRAACVEKKDRVS